MFTGIIQEIGTIKKIAQKGDNRGITIEAKKILQDQKDGDSININGVCSTITKIDKSSFTIEYMPETLKRTTAQDWHEKQEVNLESAMKLSDKINGHLVLGHIDATGNIKKITDKKESKEITISFPQELAQFIAFKGSISVDGVSLTVSKLSTNDFNISLVPYTIDNTVFKNAKEKDKVNIEIDMLSRYLKRMFDARDKESSYEFLKERGFI